MSWPTDLSGMLAPVAGHLPLLLAAGWLIRVPPMSREEGHEAITRQAWEGLELTDGQQRALIRGVRTPDAGLFGILTSALPFAQRRHALRAWSGTTTDTGIREMREFLAATHFRALALPDGRRRWALFGEVLHCLQDSYSPAHTDRDGARIVRMKHWGPMDGLRRGSAGDEASDEHGFPSDRRDSAWSGGTLTEEAGAAVAASRRYLEIAMRQPGFGESHEAQKLEFATFLDGVVRAVRRDPSDTTTRSDQLPGSRSFHSRSACRPMRR
jgi:hypothetical protein